MAELDPGTLVTIVTIVVAVIGIVPGAVITSAIEGRAALKALEGIIRQPEAARDIRNTLLISMALLETAAIYVLLIILVLIFANPLLDRFFPTG